MKSFATRGVRSIWDMSTSCVGASAKKSLCYSKRKPPPPSGRQQEWRMKLLTFSCLTTMVLGRFCHHAGTWAAPRLSYVRGRCPATCHSNADMILLDSPLRVESGVLRHCTFYPVETPMVCMSESETQTYSNLSLSPSRILGCKRLKNYRQSFAWLSAVGALSLLFVMIVLIFACCATQNTDPTERPSVNRI